MSETGDAVFGASFRLTPDEVESTEALLFDSGALAVTLADAGDNPLLEPLPGEHPLWPTITLDVFFSDEPTLGAACKVVERAHGKPYETRRIESAAWNNTQSFKPLTFGKRLKVVASDDDVNTDDETTTISIRPGLAFGTGLHPTTALCLTDLSNSPPKGLDCTDFGCGSGILALAALALGAQSALAIDHDEQALEATKNNAALNGFGRQLKIRAPERLVDASCDVLMANILLRPLCELATEYAAHVRPGGRILLSGILHDQVATLRENYSPYFEDLTETQLDEWSLLAGTRRSTTMG